jgi:hypothetical protein
MGQPHPEQYLLPEVRTDIKTVVPMTVQHLPLDASLDNNENVDEKQY